MPSITGSDMYELLKEEIITLVLAPGESISEIETAKRFGVSRTPTRDAFKRLEADNLITIVPQKGTFIAPINLMKIIDYIFMREKIEIGVAIDCLKIINDYSFKQLELSLIKQHVLIENTNLSTADKAHQFYEYDNEFHKMIFNCINKTSIWNYLPEILPDYSRFRVVSAEFHSEEGLQSLYEHHKQIYQCLLTKDEKALCKVYHQHINTGVDAISHLLENKPTYFI